MIRAASTQFHVRIDGAGETIPCGLRGKLKKEWQRVTALVVVGDRVVVARPEGGGGVIERIEERRNKFSRPGFHGYEHVVAANVDQMLVVVSAVSPPFKPNLVDRFLVHARGQDVAPLVALNKCDLEEDARIEEAIARFQDPDLFVLTSARTGRGVEEIRARLAGKTTVLLGQSGVGKTTLLHALSPGVDARTQGISVSNKGKHTTTASTAYDVPGGGILIDTPGMKGLGVWAADEAEASGAFPEIEEHAGRCRFRDCRHDREPGCAVKEALEAGVIDARNYRSFVRIRRGA
ncbi:MAG: ribosome small subunit-dependent GTPase A [bacterium]